ncbi:MAG: glutamyl-tRNA reductase [Syntrophomonadaceae bacterium]|nr:glutamyl-tRNA reductase [Syntrophomonadaceae bacterium]
MYILLAGLSHKTAPVELREKIALSGKALERFYQDIEEEPALEGTVVLSTCNRVEVYTTTRDLEAGKKALRDLVAQRLEVDDEYLDQVLYMPSCYQAVEHLFRVASGLESMIVGETEILGQVRQAYDQARERGVSSGVLNTLFQKAISVGKRVRTETGVDRNAVSISYAAVEKAKQVFGSLKGRTVLVVGAGKMSGLALRYLMDNGVTTVVVSNRSYDRAIELAGRVGGKAVRLDRLYEELEKADIVISCTAASHYVIRRKDLEPCLARRSTDLLLIDIAVPRDIDPAIGGIPGVHLYDIDDLNNVVQSNLLARQRAARQAERIIAAETEEFNDWLATLSVVPVIKALKARGEEIRQAEVRRALNRLGNVSPREEKVINALASSIVNQLLHFPVVNLKEMAAGDRGHLYAEVTKKLFQLEVDAEEHVDAQNQGRNQG